MNGLLIVIAAVAAIILLLIVTNIRIVPQSRAWVMERIGVYSKTWHTGLHIKFPIIERAAKKVDLREQILVCGEAFNHNQYHSHSKWSSERYKNRSQIERNDYQAQRANDSISAMNSATIGVGAAGGVGANLGAGAGVNLGIAGVGVGAGANAGVGLSAGVGVSGGMASSGDRSSRTSHSEKVTERPYYSLYSGGVHTTSPYNPVHNPQSQPVITKDNVSMEMDTVIFYQITDPKLFVYGHANPLKAIEHLVATSLRNIVGGLELDETLTSRELINSKIRVVLDEVTDAWGIKITRVELKNIIISDVELAEAMEKQMIAEREKRAAILKAEGESQSKILEAEGLKKHEILIAEGKAEAIRLVNEAKPSQEFLHIRALEAYEEAARGNATKIIVPSNLQSLAGLALSGSEVFKEGEKMGE